MNVHSEGAQLIPRPWRLEVVLIIGKETETKNLRVEILLRFEGLVYKINVPQIIEIGKSLRGALLSCHIGPKKTGSIGALKRQNTLGVFVCFFLVFYNIFGVCILPKWLINDS